MTDAEISHKLALAIGYAERDVAGATHSSAVTVRHAAGPINAGQGWYLFDYTDPAVIWPIAKHYKCFPYHSQFDRPGRKWAAVLGGKVYEAAAPEMAVALAVIGNADGIQKVSA